MDSLLPFILLIALSVILSQKKKKKISTWAKKLISLGATLLALIVLAVL